MSCFYMKIVNLRFDKNEPLFEFFNAQYCVLKTIIRNQNEHQALSNLQLVFRM